MEETELSDSEMDDYIRYCFWRNLEILESNRSSYGYEMAVHQEKMSIS